MTAPSVTYTFSNGTTADATQVNQNFTDVINGITDGTKDLTISALTVGGTATFNGNVAVGNASSDDLTVTASLASDLPIKTNTTYDIGSLTKGLAELYMGGTSTFTAKLAAATLSASRNYTIPEVSADASFVMTQGAQTIVGVKTFSSGIAFANETLSTYDEGTGTLTWTGGAGIFSADQSITYSYVQIGKLVTITLPAKSASADTTPAASGTNTGATDLPSAIRPVATVNHPCGVTLAGSDSASPGICSINTAGQVIFYASSNYTTNWGSSGTNGWAGITFSYRIT